MHPSPRPGLPPSFSEDLPVPPLCPPSCGLSYAPASFPTSLLRLLLCLLPHYPLPPLPLDANRLDLSFMSGMFNADLTIAGISGIGITCWECHWAAGNQCCHWLLVLPVPLTVGAASATDCWCCPLLMLCSIFGQAKWSPFVNELVDEFVRNINFRREQYVLKTPYI